MAAGFVETLLNGPQCDRDESLRSPPLLVRQLPSYLGEEEACQQASRREEEEAAGDAGHATAAKEVEPGHRGDVQGGPSSHASAEPAPGPVSAAAGAHDEPPGEDDPASLRHVSVVGSGWGQRPREALKCVGRDYWETSRSCLPNSLFDTKDKAYLFGISV